MAGIACGAAFCEQLVKVNLIRGKTRPFGRNLVARWNLMACWKWFQRTTFPEPDPCMRASISLRVA